MDPGLLLFIKNNLLFYCVSKPISRVMSWVIIYLGHPLPNGSSGPPESTTGSRIAFFSALLQMEFTCARPVTRPAVVSYTTFPPLPQQVRRFISVALVWESPPPDVIRHPALRSPDFPRLNPFVCSAAITWPGCASAILARFFALVKKFHSLLFTPFSVTLPKFISNCLRQWNFGLYVSGFWHIHAKTPRGIVACEQ